MREVELKETLGKIQPGEQLIQATLLKVEEQRSKKENSVFLWMKSYGYRYVAAVCALVLLIGIGRVTLHMQGNVSGEPQEKTVQRSLEQETENTDGIQIAAYTLEDDTDSGWVKGVLCACTLCEVTAEEKNAGIVAHATLLLEQSEDEILCAEMYFYEEAELEQLLTAMSKELYFRMISEETDGKILWEALEFSAEPK